VQSALREVVGPIICDPTKLQTTAFLGPRYVCFDRGGQIIETTQQDDERLTVVLDRMERVGSADPPD
jgi:hypothetical protein